MTRQTTHPRREARRQRAADRAEQRAARSDADQLAVLARRGIHEGREVNRLKARTA